MKPIIEIRGLSKRYSLGETSLPVHNTLVDSLSNQIKRAKNFLLQIGKTKKSDPTAVEELWALKNINLTIHEGDCYALIGRNGAGKSTLLKILAGIVFPSEGFIRYRGRITSLLEVGTGFHPELSGKENIYLNGAILGLSRSEILRRFDQIVAFSELAAFLETPVKRYSSGMITRLGFAIAAHLDSDLLIVDEVLAVGDQLFQQKCMAHMEQMRKDGKTLLFVSHDQNTVHRLCNRGAFLEHGRVIVEGPISDCMSVYTERLRLSQTI